MSNLFQKTKTLFWDSAPIAPADFDNLDDLDLPPDPPKEIISLDKIYEENGIAPISFPAEKLLAVLDNLPEMPLEAQRATLTALSATKDWTVDSIGGDASLKLQALKTAINQYRESHVSIDQIKRDNIEKETKYLSSAAQTIRDEIVSLQKKLEEETLQVKQNIENITSDASKKSQEVNSKIAESQQQINKLEKLLMILDWKELV